MSVAVTSILWAGGGLGAAVGYAAARSHFCALGAISDGLLFGDWGRMRAWALALAVALAGTGLLAALGRVDTARALYAAPRLYWLAHLVGGACFGAGMVLASGCGNKTLVRLAGGNLKSLVVLLVMGLTAWITLRGVLGVPRIGVLQASQVTLELGAPQTLPHLLPGALPLAAWQGGLGTGLALLLAAVAWRDRDFRADRERWVAALVIGAAIIAAWYLTANLGLGEDPETLEATVLATFSHQAEAMSFVAPVANLIEWLVLFSDTRLGLSYGAATALGVVAGAGLHAVSRRAFRWEAFTSAADMGRHLGGAALMGFGGVTATGCSFGQGLSGFSLLSLGALITAAAIFGGAALVLRRQAAAG